MKINKWASVAALALGMATAGASADTVIVFNTGDFSGAQSPAGPGPYLTATFQDTATDEVKLTLSNTLTGTEFVTGWYFNLQSPLLPSSISILGLDVTDVTGWGAALRAGTNTDTDLSEKDAAFKADGDGYFDVRFDFEQGEGAGRFTGGETASFTLTGTGLTAASFEAISVFGNDPAKNGFYSAAHIQGIGATGADSGWIAGDLAVVPLPAAVWGGLLLMGGLGGYRKVRGRRDQM